MAIWGCGGGADRAEDAAEVGELGESVDAGDEESGVDGLGDRGAGADRCGDGDVEDVGHVSGGEGAFGFLDDDDGVVRTVSGACVVCGRGPW